MLSANARYDEVLTNTEAFMTDRYLRVVTSRNGPILGSVSPAANQAADDLMAPTMRRAWAGRSVGWGQWRCSVRLTP